jgi:hypothetical protein
MAGFCVWACSGTVTEMGVPAGGAAGMPENAQAGATQGGVPDVGAADGGEAGVRAAFADAGASGEGFAGAAGAGADGGSAGAVDPGNFWDCEAALADENAADPSRVSSAEPSSLPSGDEATLEQLVGDWFHDSTAYYNGNIDHFHFSADGTGTQVTDTVLWETGSATEYVGTIELAAHVITLDSTAGTRSSYDSLANGLGHPGSESQEDLPRQTLRFGYSYDADTDSLYVNNVVCSEPVRFVRVER